jgi:predicted ATPase
MPGANFITGARRLFRYRWRKSQASKLTCHFSFSADAKGEAREILQLQPVLTRCNLQIEISTDGDDEPALANFEMKRSAKPVEERARSLGIDPKSIAPTDLGSLEYEVLQPSVISPRKYQGYGFGRVKPVGCKLAHFLPTAYSVAYDKTEAHARQVVTNFLSDEPSTFDDEDLPFLNEPFLMAVKEMIEKYATKKLSAADTLEFRTKRLRASLELLQGDLNPSNLLKAIKNLGVRFRLSAQSHFTSLIRLAKGNQKSHQTLTSLPAPDEILEASQVVRGMFSESFKYLGPLRDEPKHVYPIEGVSDPADVGLKGQYTAAVLDLHKGTYLRYIPSHCFSNPGAEIKPRDATLSEAIQDWLNYLNVVQKFKTRDRGIFGHELQVATCSSNDLHNLSHVGVGVSQVLPILVMSLLADAGSVLVFEQPEIHLNPKVQTLLADFLLSMAHLGKQCIVETHSEYLINRLRYRAVVDEGDKTSSLMKIYFVENDKGVSRYRQLAINEYGAIEDWPQGFFDETPSEAENILRAAMAKRSRSKGNG